MTRDGSRRSEEQVLPQKTPLKLALAGFQDKPPRLIPDLVPEPGTLVLLSLGVGLFLMVRPLRGDRERRVKRGKGE